MTIKHIQIPSGEDDPDAFIRKGGVMPDPMPIEDATPLNNTPVINALMQNPTEDNAAPAAENDLEPDVSFKILETAPAVIDRPLRVIGNRAFAATWVPVQKTVRRVSDEKTGDVIEFDPPRIETHHRLVVIDNNGEMYADPQDSVPDTRPFTKALVEMRLPKEPPYGSLLSGKGLMAYAKGERTDVPALYADLVLIVDTYIDFHGCFADQQTMCRLVATYILSNAFIDAFPVIGYLWIHGESGSGKTQLLLMIHLLSIMGTMVTNSGTTAALRDIAASGGALCIDDAEKITGKDVDPSKQSLLLAGNRRDATVPLKEASADGRGWTLKQVPVYCPRIFSATTMPIETLRNRCVVIPMVPSNEAAKANATPEDDTTWPNKLIRRDVLDRIWMTVLEHLPSLPEYDKEALRTTSLRGRSHQVWRALFATALWLESQGVVGVHGEMEQAANDYQSDVFLAAKDSRRHLVLKALWELVNDTHGGDRVPCGKVLPTKLIWARANEKAVEYDLSEDGEHLYSVKQIGWTMRSLGFRKPESRNPKHKEWFISPAEVRRLMEAQGMDLGDSDTPDKTAQTTNTQQTAPNPAVSDFSAVAAVSLDRTEKCPVCDGEGCKYCVK